MKVLLDTHVWLWLQTEPERITQANLTLLADETTELFLSAASAWEIVIKYALGKLPLPEPPGVYVPSRMSASGALPLPVSTHHALAVADLPLLHADPFDRLLIAQARTEKLTIMTADEKVTQYDVVSIRA